MDFEIATLTLQTIGNFMGITITPLMTVIVGKKTWKEYKEFNNLNIVRFLIFLIFFSFSWALIWANLYESTALKEILPSFVHSANQIEDVTFFSLGVGLMVTFALILIAYANQWEVLYITPLFVFGGSIILFLFTGDINIYSIYILFSGIIGLIFFYLTGFRLRDNGSLGLGVLFTFAFLSLIFGENLIGQIFNISTSIFGIIFVLGYFNLFQKEEVY